MSRPKRGQTTLGRARAGVKDHPYANDGVGSVTSLLKALRAWEKRQGLAHSSSDFAYGRGNR